MPSASGFIDRLRASILPESEAMGEQIGKILADRVAAGIRDGIGDGFRNGRVSGAKGGEESGGAFADAFKAKVTAALQALPKVDIDADSSEADRKIAALRARLMELSDKKVGVDIDAKTAMAEVDRIKIALTELGAKSPDVRVKTDTLKASAQLALFQAEVNKIDGEEPEVKPKVEMSGMGALIAAGVGLGTTLIPIAAAATAALVSIGMAATAAGAAAGVAFIALKPIMGAVTALSAQQNVDPAIAAAQARSQAAAQASAIAGLSSAQAAAAAGAVSAARAVSDAQRAAAQGVASAEQALASAQVQARAAQVALTDARKAATQQLEDYQTQLADGALAQRAAILSIEQAKQSLDATNANAGSTQLQRQQAQLTYDQAVQQNTDLGIQQARLKVNAAEAVKAGVEGSTLVVNAQRGVTTANQGVERSQAALVEAQRKGAEQVTVAILAQATQAQTSAASVASAQRALATALTATGTAGEAAANKVAEAFAKLTPAGATFATFLFGLRNQFGEVSAAAQNGFLPGLQQFIQMMLPYLPQIASFVGKVSTAMGDLFVAAGKALTGPFWTQFFAFLDRETPKWITGLFTTIGNIVTGLSGLFQALAPVGDVLNGAIADGAKAFADWATSLSTNKGFQDFLAYVIASLPAVGDFLKALFLALAAMFKALAPIGIIVLHLLTNVLNFIAGLKPSDIYIIAGAMTALYLSIKVLPGAIDAVKIAWALMQTVVFWWVVLIAAVVVAFVLLYQHNKTFRKVVDEVWGAVKKFIVDAWDNHIKPALTALWKFFIEKIFPTIKMLWNDVVKPAFTQIGGIIKNVWENIVKPALKALWDFIQYVLAPVFMWLLNNVVGPVFKGIGEGIKWAWEHLISPALSILNSAISGMGGVFQATVDTIKRIWNTLGQIIQDPIGSVLRFIENFFIVPINKMLKGVFGDGAIQLPDIVQPTIAGSSPGNSSSVVSDWRKPAAASPSAHLTAGSWATGGWTGAGNKYEPAGIVHADEFVVNKESQNAISRDFPGLLDYMNTHGRLPGYDAGGFVSGLVGTAGAVLSKIVDGAELAAKVITNPAGAIHDFVAGLVGQLAKTPFVQIGAGVMTKVSDAVIAKVTNLFSAQSQQSSTGPLTQGVPGSASAASAVQYALGQIMTGAGGWLDRCLAFVNAAWGHKVGWLGLPRAIDAWNAAPGKHPGDTHPPAGAALFYDHLGPAGHVDLSLGGNSLASTDLPTPGRVGLNNFNDPMTKWGAHYLGWALPGYAGGGKVGAGFTKPLLMDFGGTLPTGMSAVRNDTGAPERLIRADHVQPSRTINFNGNVGWNPTEVVAKIDARERDVMAMLSLGLVSAS